ncbi:MAG: protein kinase [Planctomycetota bacterium]
MIAVKRGDRISEYVLEEPLGRGAFGEVWRARHHIWNEREVAVKIPTTTEAVRQLSNEGVIQASLDHPGIAKSLGMDTTGNPPYFITEYVRGRDLSQVLGEKGRFAAAEALTIFRKVLDVLAYAHERGVIHQDIKPSNILIGEDGGVKLTDFGLGQTTNGDSLLLSASLRSEAATISGTLAYIAPEVRDGTGRADARADLYSLGIVLFEMLTGSRPAGVEVPSDLRDDLPAWCDEVFRGLYTRRERRFADVAAVRSALASSVAAAPESRPASKKPVVVPLTAPPLPRGGEKQLVPARVACHRLGIGPADLMAYVERGWLTQVHAGTETLYYADEIESRRSEDGAQATRDGVASRPPRAHPIPVQGGLATRRAAGFWARGLAMTLDLAILGAAFALLLPEVLLPVRWVLSWVSLGGSNPLIALVLLGMLYFSLTTGLWGRTLGKAIVGLRVVRQNGDPVNVFDGFVRTVNYVASLLPFGLGFLVIPFSSRRLAFHDLMCGTRVVHDEGQG